MIRTLGVGGVPVDDEEKYDAKGSVDTSNRASESGCGADCEAEVDESPRTLALAEVRGFAVKTEGSNSRVLSKVRGMFSSKRFFVMRA